MVYYYCFLLGLSTAWILVVVVVAVAVVVSTAGFLSALVGAVLLVRSLFVFLSRICLDGGGRFLFLDSYGLWSRLAGHLRVVSADVNC